jgi:ribokinase
VPAAGGTVNGGRVTVIGAVNVDMVVTTPRLPGPGQTVVGPGVERYGGGKGANAAVAAARAGARVRYIGAVGADDLGRAALAELVAEGVNVDDVAVLHHTPTGVALIVVDGEGENQIAVGAGANDHVDPDAVRTALDKVLPETDCVLISTEIPGAAVAAAVEKASAAGVLCILNPAPVIPAVVDVLELGPVITPNGGELDDLVSAPGMSPDSDADDRGTTPSERARGLSSRTGAAVVVTLGGDGALVVTADGDTAHLPPRPTTVRDTTGAGDTFNGVLAAHLAGGDALLNAVRAANCAAAMSVAAVGARNGMPSADGIRKALQDG